MLTITARGAAYLDEACTQPYEYPGDGTDFTVYVRNEVE